MNLSGTFLRTSGVLLSLAVALITLSPAHAAVRSSTSYSIQQDTISSGAGTSTSTNFQVTGIVGQPVASKATSTSFNLTSGFTMSFLEEDPGQPPVLTQIPDFTRVQGASIHNDPSGNLELYVSDADHSVNNIQFSIINDASIDANFGLSIGLQGTTFQSRADNSIHMHPAGGFTGFTSLQVQAQDSSGNLSNVITFNITIQTDTDGDNDPDVTDPDDDNDGMTDAYESANGLDPLDASGNNGANGDLDGDGVLNIVESLAGTNANNAFDAPAFTDDSGSIGLRLGTYNAFDGNNLELGNGFGRSLDLKKQGNGGYAVYVGAPQTNALATQDGAAYLMQSDGSGNWRQSIRTKSNSGVAYSLNFANYGTDVSMLTDASGTPRHILSGSPYAPEPIFGNTSGAASTFKTYDASGNNWVEIGFEYNPDNSFPDPATNSAFGTAVKLLGDSNGDITQRFISAPDYDSGDGRVYAEYNYQTQTLMSDGNAYSSFGREIVVGESRSNPGYATNLIISSPQEDGTGAVYVFNFDASSNFVKTHRITPPDSGNYFGSHIDATFDASGNIMYLMIGDTSLDGGAYLYSYNDQTSMFDLEQKLVGSGTGYFGNPYFGQRVALMSDASGNVTGAFVSAPYLDVTTDASNNTTSSGGVHTYLMDASSNLVAMSILHNDVLSQNDIFGHDIKLITDASGELEVLAIGVPGNSQSLGHVMLYDNTNTDGDAFIDVFDLDPASASNNLDSDLDGISDVLDNCPTAPNFAQSDSNSDGIGDVCAADSDGDGIDDSVDNCPLIGNLGQEDNDGDLQGDACDPDDDNDGLSDAYENANGLDPLDDSGNNGASGDLDGDGFTNTEEQTAGSAANDASSNAGTILFSAPVVDYGAGIFIPTQSIVEADASANMLLSRSGGSVGAVSVTCSTNDGFIFIDPATAGSDYVSLAGQVVSWADGDQSDKTCDIAVLNDSDTENTEHLLVEISAPTGGVKIHGEYGSAILDIEDHQASANTVDRDFNGDGKSDIVLRNADGRFWLLQQNGYVTSASNEITTVPMSLRVVSMDDFNGDGRADMLLRNESNGDILLWQMDGHTITSSDLVNTLPTTWRIISTGDFNGDDKADILLRSTVNGSMWMYEMDGATRTDTNLVVALALDWSVIATDDFGGDGKDDILIRHTDGRLHLYQMNGHVLSGNDFVGNLPTSWDVIATEDFGGDGKADILLRHTDGRMYLYQMNGHIKAQSNLINNLSTVWDVVATDDFGGDGKADILIRHSGDGRLWLYQMNGHVFASSDLVGNLFTAWSVIGTDDYNGDGKADMLLRHTNGSLWMYEMDGHVKTLSNALSTAYAYQSDGQVLPNGRIDGDADGVDDLIDNCASTSNRGQENLDGDAEGDICDSDIDGDGMSNDYENANGLDASDASGNNGAAGDLDGDGFTNLEESSSGSAANDSGSNAGKIAFATNSVTVSEDVGNAMVNASRIGGTVGAISVSCYTNDGSGNATVATDYTGLSAANVLSWTDGEGIAKPCSVAIIDDAEVEVAETFTVELSNPAGGAKLENPQSANITIEDNDASVNTAVNDFGGDGKSDILLRHTDGRLHLWQMDGHVRSGNNEIAPLNTVWDVISTDDFGGDGKADILVRHNTDGRIWLYQMDGHVRTGIDFVGNLATAWSIISTDDFNGDGKADMLLRHTDGRLWLYEMNGHVKVGNNFVGDLPTAWSVVSTDDFNGDSKADILIRHTDGRIWLYEMNGHIKQASNLVHNLFTAWDIVSTGDFNGDSKADILIRHTDGRLWLYQMDGHIRTGNDFVGNLATAWSVKSTEDFGGDGKADILIRHTDGRIWLYEMNGHIKQQSNLVNSLFTAWSIEGTDDYNGDSKADILIRHTDGRFWLYEMDGHIQSGSNLIGPQDNAWQPVVN